jgi:hypothetical protein
MMLTLLRTLYELEMAHNLGHILLYRPFLHYLARPGNQAPPDTRQLRCASACIKTSRQTITRSHEMLQQGYLAPAAWQPVYTIFLSIVALIFYLATQKGSQDYHEVELEAQTGIRILASTSCQDIGSRRCLDVLKVLARRLEHHIRFDIDAVEKETMSFCQADVSIPSAPVPSQASIPPPQAAAPTGTLYAEAPYLNHHHVGPMHQHQHQQIPQPPVLRSNTNQPMNPQPMHLPTSGVPQTVRNLPQYVHPYPSGQPAMMQQRMNASTANAAMFPSNMTMGGMGDEFMTTGHASGHQHPAVDMEVPFSESFAWPFDPMVPMGQQMNGTPLDGGELGTAGSSVRQSPNGSPLTSEDIAAFMMRINPGEEPFL